MSHNPVIRMSHHPAIHIGTDLYEAINEGYCRLEDLFKACATGKIPSDDIDEQRELATSIWEKAQAVRSFEDKLRALDLIDYY